MARTNHNDHRATKNTEIMRGPRNAAAVKRVMADLKAAGLSPRHSHGAVWVAPESAKMAHFICNLVLTEMA